MKKNGFKAQEQSLSRELEWAFSVARSLKVLNHVARVLPHRMDWVGFSVERTLLSLVLKAQNGWLKF